MNGNNNEIPSEPPKSLQFHQTTRINVSIIVMFWLAYLVAHQILCRWTRKLRRKSSSSSNSSSRETDIFLSKRTSNLARLLLGSKSQRINRTDSNVEIAAVKDKLDIENERTSRSDENHVNPSTRIESKISHSLIELLAPIQSGMVKFQIPIFEGICMCATGAVILLLIFFLPLVCNFSDAEEPLRACRALLTFSQKSALFLLFLLIPAVLIVHKTRSLGMELKRRWYEGLKVDSHLFDLIFKFRGWIESRLRYCVLLFTVFIGIFSWWLCSMDGLQAFVRYGLSIFGILRFICTHGTLITVPTGMLVISLKIPAWITIDNTEPSLGKRKFESDREAKVKRNHCLEYILIGCWHAMAILLLLQVSLALEIPLLRIVSGWTIGLCHVCGVLTLFGKFQHTIYGIYAVLAVALMASLSIPRISYLAGILRNGKGDSFLVWRGLLLSTLAPTLYWRLVYRKSKQV